MILVAEKSWLEIWKDKKMSSRTWYSNHPNRFANMRLSGDINYERDTRITATVFDLSATHMVYDLDFSILPTWERNFFENGPIFYEPSTDTSMEFKAAAGYNAPLSVSCFYGATPSAVTIGTKTVYAYSRPSDADPWVLDSTTTTDYNLSWKPSVSGGSYTDDTTITAFPAAGPSVPADPDIIKSTIYNVPFYRAPLDSWASESDVYSDIFAAELADLNTADGGGHSGLCTLTFNFTP